MAHGTANQRLAYPARTMCCITCRLRRNPSWRRSFGHYLPGCGAWCAALGTLGQTNARRCQGCQDPPLKPGRYWHVSQCGSQRSIEPPQSRNTPAERRIAPRGFRRPRHRRVEQQIFIAGAARLKHGVDARRVVSRATTRRATLRLGRRPTTLRRLATRPIRQARG